MVQKHRCPRCGQNVESDYCPRCDLEFTDRGIIRKEITKIDNKPIKSALDYSIEQANKAKEERTDIFTKRFEDNGITEETDTAITDYLEQTVGDVLEEQEAETLKNIFNNEVVADEVAIDFSKEPKYVIKNIEDSNDEIEFSINDKEITNYERKSQTNKVINLEAKDESVNKKPTKSKKASTSKQRGMIIASLTVLLVAIIAAIILFATQQKNNQPETQEAKITKEINVFYVDSNSKDGYLEKQVDQASLQPVKQQITNLAKTDKTAAEKLTVQVDQLEKNQELINRINNLYVSPKIQKAQILNPALKENVNIDLVEVENPQNNLEKAINESIKDAKEQKAQMDKAKELMDKVYKDNQVVQGATKGDYLAAKKAVDAVKNQDFKKHYNEALTKVEAQLK